MEEIKNKNTFYLRFAITYLVFPMIPLTLILVIILLLSLITRGLSGDDVMTVVITFFLLNVIWLLCLLLFGLIIRKLQYYKADVSSILIASYPIGKEHEIKYDDIKNIVIYKHILLTKVKIIADKKITLCFATKEDALLFLKESVLESYISE